MAFCDPHLGASSFCASPGISSCAPAIGGCHTDFAACAPVASHLHAAPTFGHAHTTFAPAIAPSFAAAPMMAPPPAMIPTGFVPTPPLGFFQRLKMKRAAKRASRYPMYPGLGAVGYPVGCAPTACAAPGFGAPLGPGFGGCY